jgi:Ca2+-binding EF-hand superfamily protein
VWAQKVHALAGVRTACAILFSLVLGSAWAQEATERLFDSLDLDGDGYVSLAEAAGNAAVVERFDRADRDRDGKLSRKEFRKLKKVRVRVAHTRKERERLAKAKQDKQASAAVGGSAAKVRSKEKPAPESGG